MKRLRGSICITLTVWLAFICTMLGAGNAWADEGVVEISSSETTATTYTSLSEAFQAAQVGDTVKLIADVSLTGGVDVVQGKDLTLDLNGFTISDKADSASYTGDYLIAVHFGGKLTVTDNSTAQNGAITTTRPSIYCGIKMTVANDPSSNGTAVLVVNQGTIQGYYFGVSGQGERHGTDITINGGHLIGYLEGDSYGIYHPQDGTLKITGGTIEGATGVEMRSGTLEVSGGTITGKASEYSVNPNAGGTTTVGAGLAIAQHTTRKAISVNLTGGSISGTKAISYADPQKNDNDEAINITASKSFVEGSGNLTLSPDCEWWPNGADGYKLHKHTFPESPKWRWLRIDDKWSVISTYFCMDDECDTRKNLPAEMAEGEGSPTIYRATDGKDQTGSFTANQYTVTYDGKSKTVEWGIIAQCLSSNPSQWKVGNTVVADGPSEYMFAVTSDADVTAENASAGSPRAIIISTIESENTANGKGAAFKAKWSLPTGAVVSSAIIYRGTTSTDATVSDDNLVRYGSKYDTGLKVATGDFTFHLDGLKSGTWQHVLIKIVYTLNGTTTVLTSSKTLPIV